MTTFCIQKQENALYYCHFWFAERDHAIFAHRCHTITCKPQSHWSFFAHFFLSRFFSHAWITCHSRTDSSRKPHFYATENGKRKTENTYVKSEHKKSHGSSHTFDSLWNSPKSPKEHFSVTCPKRGQPRNSSGFDLLTCQFRVPNNPRNNDFTRTRLNNSAFANRSSLASFSVFFKHTNTISQCVLMHSWSHHSKKNHTNLVTEICQYQLWCQKSMRKSQIIHKKTTTNGRAAQVSSPIANNQYANYMKSILKRKTTSKTVQVRYDSSNFDLFWGSSVQILHSHHTHWMCMSCKSTLCRPITCFLRLPCRYFHSKAIARKLTVLVSFLVCRESALFLCTYVTQSLVYHNHIDLFFAHFFLAFFLALHELRAILAQTQAQNPFLRNGKHAENGKRKSRKIRRLKIAWKYSHDCFPLEQSQTPKVTLFCHFPRLNCPKRGEPKFNFFKFQLAHVSISTYSPHHTSDGHEWVTHTSRLVFEHHQTSVSNQWF